MSDEIEDCVDCTEEFECNDNEVVTEDTNEVSTDILGEEVLEKVILSTLDETSVVDTTGAKIEGIKLEEHCGKEVVRMLMSSTFDEASVVEITRAVFKIDGIKLKEDGSVCNEEIG